MCSGPPLRKLKQIVLSFGAEKALKDAGKLLQIFYDVNYPSPSSTPLGASISRGALKH